MKRLKNPAKAGQVSLLLFFIACATPIAPQLKRVIIFPKSSTKEIAEQLKSERIIDNPKKFVILAKLLGFEKRLKSGRYLIKENSDELSVLRVLARGGEERVLVTIPEGKTLIEIGGILEEEGITSAAEFVKAGSDSRILRDFGIPYRSVEGYLFPDSYDFLFGEDPKSIIKRMVERFFSVYNQLKTEFGSAGLKDNEIVILASIIEKEAVLGSEKPIISGVFINRFKKRLPLQSCATIQYILPRHKERLSYEDLKIESPYNTYLNIGFPPGPICNPGKEALKAAVFPQKTDYLYFVSRGDGSHHFSKTLREHEIASRRYQ